MAAYYNEIEPYAAQWLRNLIAAGHIAPGDVDERDIRDVSPSDLVGYTQCHFFAGIGLWSAALRGAGWPDDREVWTGSCPCQPFSAAGRRTGLADERHLWPHFHYLIEQRRPRVVFGEQVANGDGLAWFDLVHADLEGTGYAAAALDLCAAGFGAPHWRQRLYWVADADEHADRQGGALARGGACRSDAVERAGFSSSSSARRLADNAEPGWQSRGRSSAPGDGRRTARIEPGRLCDAGVLADGESDRRRGRAHDEDGGRRQLTLGRDGAPGGMGDGDSQRFARGSEPHVGTQRSEQPASRRLDASRSSALGGMGDSSSVGSSLRELGAVLETRWREIRGAVEQSGRALPLAGSWGDADWIECLDGKWRPIEPGSFPLDHGHPQRVGKLRAYGNGIVPEQAQEFVAAYMAFDDFRRGLVLVDDEDLF